MQDVSCGQIREGVPREGDGAEAMFLEQECVVCQCGRCDVDMVSARCSERERKLKKRRKKSERVCGQRMTFSSLALFIVRLLCGVKTHRERGGNGPNDCLLFSEARSGFLLEIEGQCHKIHYKFRKGKD
jgi:hypothetical protein